MFIKTLAIVEDIQLSDISDQKTNARTVTFPFGDVTIEFFNITKNFSDGIRGSFKLTYINEVSVSGKLKQLTDAYCLGHKPKQNMKCRAITTEDLTAHTGPEVPLSLYPKKLESFLIEESYKASNRLKSFISTLRWRFNIDTKLQPWSKIETHCSSNENFDWRLISNLDVYVKSEKNNAIPINMVIDEETIELALAEDGEPTGHELLREAKQISSISVRASLIMAIASVEIRLKDLISSRSPSSEWLIKTIPSPPVAKIVKGYLPELFDEYESEIKKFTQTKYFKLIETQIENRNKTSHLGAEGPKGFVIYELLESVEQFLWFCDFLSGFSWSRDYFVEDVENCFIKVKE